MADTPHRVVSWGFIIGQAWVGVRTIRIKSVILIQRKDILSIEVPVNSLLSLNPKFIVNDEAEHRDSY